MKCLSIPSASFQNQRQMPKTMVSTNTDHRTQATDILYKTVLKLAAHGA